MIDVHKQKAVEIFGVGYDDVTPEQRAKGKDDNYVSWYMAQTESIAQRAKRELGFPIEGIEA